MSTLKQSPQCSLAVAVIVLVTLTAHAATTMLDSGSAAPLPEAWRGAHYTGKGLLNPNVDLSVLIARVPAQVASLPMQTNRVAASDARRFNTWSGYASGRFPEGVTTGDFNADGAVDVAFARSDFFQQGMTVQLNAGDGTLRPAQSYPASDESSDIKAGDLDGDADLDLVVVSMGSSLVNATIDLYFNDGRGAFTRRTAAGGLGPQKLALADLDGDGDLDLAMSSGLFQRVVSVLLNEGDGTFATETRYDTGESPLGIAAADFDRDGDADLAVARYDTATLKTYVQIWRNDGAARFTRAREVTLIQAGERPSLITDDFNGDGRPDLALGMYGNRQVVMLGKAQLGFDQQVYPTGWTAWDLTSGDLDGDGDSDIVLATWGSSSTGDMSILRNTGDGTFTPIRFSSGFNPHDAAIADFDANGKADIVVAQGGTDTGSIHLQRGDMKFGAPGLFRTPLPVGSVESSDVDHDGDLDLVLSINEPYEGIGFVQIMENDGHAAFTAGQLIPSGLRGASVGHVQPGDLNGDGWDDLVWNDDQFNEPVAPIVTSLNDGTGTFETPVVFAGTARNGAVSVGDLDNDGDLDLASPQFTELIAVYLNNGDATFGSARTIPLADFPGMIAIADLSGDGMLDLATVHNGVYGSGKKISVLRGTGNARFAIAEAYTVGQGPIEIVAADLDKDGDLDLITSNNGGDDISNFADESTTTLLNDSTGHFAGKTNYPGEAINYYLSEWAIAASDIDADGNVDIIVSNVLGNDAGVYYGKGDGTLEREQVRYGLQNGAQDFAVADFNGDGSMDIAASGYLQSVDPLFPPTGIVVLKNRGVE